MNRMQLMEMIIQGTSKMLEFIHDDGDDSGRESSYEEWNVLDIAGHIVGWLDYSADKLSSLKFGTPQSAEYSGVAGIDEVNRILYDKYRGASKQEIESKYLGSFGSYIKVLSAFSDEDINSSSFDTGFNMILWRYMLMDTVIHPVQHAIYQHLKRGNHDRLVTIITDLKDTFGIYSADLEGLRLSEFHMENPVLQERLTELQNGYPENGTAMTFIRVNRHVNRSR